MGSFLTKMFEQPTPAAKEKTGSSILSLAAGLASFRKNPHRGFATSTAILYPGLGLANSNTASGLQVFLYDSGRRSRSTGKERDAETGLDYFESRYFSAAQGRFTSPDEPFAGWNQQNPQSWNLYSYGLNNPLRYVDPDGHDPCVNGINPETGNICTVVTAQKPKAAPPPDVVLDSPLFFAVARGVQQAKPGVDLAGAGLMTFFSFVAPFTTAATQCVAGNCDKTNLAMAAIPGGAEGEILEGLTRWGWAGTKKFLAAVRLLKQPGTHEAIEGIVPTLEEAKALIQKAGGTIDRIEEGHAVGGVSEHTYPHINYTTPSGAKATVQVGSIGK